MSVPNYAITIQAVVIDGESLFQATVKELPDVAEYADSPDEAYALALDTIQTTAQIFAEKGRQMPQAWAVSDDYSGRVTLRVSKTLHRDLAELADAEGVSLNQQIVNALSHYIGYLSAKTERKEDFSFVGSRGSFEAIKAADEMATPAPNVSLVAVSSSVVVQDVPFLDDGIVEISRTKKHLWAVK